MVKYYVYKTTFVEDGRFYIGVRKSSNIESDPYLGSGKIIANMIKKHGREKFKREIFTEFETKEEAFALEKQIVNEDLLKDPKCVNLALGGHGGEGPAKYVSKDGASYRGKIVGDVLRGRTKETHDYIRVLTEKCDIKRKSTNLKNSKAQKEYHANSDNFEKIKERNKKSGESRKGKTKETCSGRKAQSEKISGKNNVMCRQEVLEKFIGKTKENCEWRARQAQSVSNTLTGRSKDTYQYLIDLGEKVSGEKNGMYGKFGEFASNSKLTNNQRLEIIRLFEIDNRTRVEIYELFKDFIGLSSIKKIIQNRAKIKETLISL